jgi:hypothetical protein
MNVNDVIENLKLYPLAILSFVAMLACLVLHFIRGDVVANLELAESELNSRIRVIEKNKANADGLETDTEALLAKVDAIDGRLFDRRKTAVNTNFFYGLENEADLVITSVSQAAKEAQVYSKGGALELDTYTALSYDFVFEAKYNEFLKLMYKLHTADPLMRVANYQISAGDSVKSSGIHNIRMNLFVLAKRNPQL